MTKPKTVRYGIYQKSSKDGVIELGINDIVIEIKTVNVKSENRNFEHLITYLHPLEEET